MQNNTLSIIMFTEPLNKSDHMRSQHQEVFPKERIERYSINKRLKKRTSCNLLTHRHSLTSWNEAHESRTAIFN